MNKFPTICCFVILLSLLGCGQKGDLYLPQDGAEDNRSSTLEEDAEPKDEY